MEKKITRKDVMSYLLATYKGEAVEMEISNETIVEVLEKELIAIEKKAVAAAARAAQKKQDGDALRAQVADLLSETPQTAAEICAKIGNDDVTVAMVVSRVGQLVRIGEAAKETHKEGNKQVTTYTAC